MDIKIDFKELLKDPLINGKFVKLIIECDGVTKDEALELFKDPDPNSLWCYIESEMEEYFSVSWGNDYASGEFCITTWTGKYFVYIDPDMDGIEGPFNTADEIIDSYAGCFECIFTEEQTDHEFYSEGYGAKFLYSGKLSDLDSAKTELYFERITNRKL
jgi:hypothetical protein